MQPDNRELICFNKEYNLFGKSIEKEKMIRYSICGLYENAYPVTIQTCPYDSEIYLFTLKRLNDNELILKTIRICDIDNLSLIDNTLIFDNVKIDKILNDYIFQYKYFEKKTLIIGD